MATRYNFKRVAPRVSSQFDGVSVHSNLIYLTKEFSKRIETSYIEIQIDEKFKAIGIYPTNIRSPYSYKVHRERGGRIYAPIKIANKMPKGRYFFKEKIAGELICRYEE